MSAAAVPDIAGEIIGWRSWYVVRHWQLEAPVLVSINGGTGWDDATHPRWPHRQWMLAQCPTGKSDVPHEGHYCGSHGRGCGIHAARDRSHLVEIGYTSFERPLVIGEVALAGKVIPGDMGWRAEKARPLRLWLPHVHWQLVRPLREAYGLPVGLTNPLKAAA